MLFEKTETWELPDAALTYTPQFFTIDEADDYFNRLKNELAWAQGTIKMFGKSVFEPRLTAWYGDEGKAYTYSGKLQHPLSWHPVLGAIRDAVQAFQACPFNSVLANYYRNGQDSMGWHSDNEPELGQNPIIASVNFGESRRFLFRRRDDTKVKHELLLTHGSLLVMAGTMQHHWQHAVPKEPKKTKPRINLTFRFIYT
jgi:alkylated DNA repair dioxygenase AlkB